MIGEEKLFGKRPVNDATHLDDLDYYHSLSEWQEKRADYFEKNLAAEKVKNEKLRSDWTIAMMKLDAQYKVSASEFKNAKRWKEQCISNRRWCKEHHSTSTENPEGE